jgi:hypothetical protein
MIKARTVLILGAGSSADFQYPVGNGLREILINQLIVVANVTAPAVALRQLGFTDELIGRFRHSLLRSGTGSVDEFLEHRPEFIPVGKVAIAEALIKFENPDNLFVPRQTWYQHLFKHTNSRFEEFGNNALRIITFNYDRSLEEYLYQALLNKYGKTEAETASALRKIPIVHVHGSLGNLPWQEPAGRRYAVTGDIGQIRSAADSIKIVHEEPGPEFQQAKELLRNIDKIVILGFGYHPNNLDRLFSGVQLHGVGIYGSFRGFTALERETIKQRFSEQYGGNLQGSSDFDCLDFLREWVVLD